MPDISCGCSFPPKFNVYHSRPHRGIIFAVAFFRHGKRPQRGKRKCCKTKNPLSGRGSEPHKHREKRDSQIILPLRNNGLLPCGLFYRLIKSDHRITYILPNNVELSRKNFNQASSTKPTPQSKPCHIEERAESPFSLPFSKLLFVFFVCTRGNLLYISSNFPP